MFNADRWLAGRDGRGHLEELLYGPLGGQFRHRNACAMAQASGIATVLIRGARDFEKVTPDGVVLGRDGSFLLRLPRLEVRYTAPRRLFEPHESALAHARALNPLHPMPPHIFVGPTTIDSLGTQRPVAAVSVDRGCELASELAEEMNVPAVAIILDRVIELLPDGTFEERRRRVPDTPYTPLRGEPARCRF